MFVLPSFWGRPRELHGPATDDSFSSRGWRPQLCGFALRVVGHSSQCGSRSEGAKGIKSQDRGRSDVERAIKDSEYTVMDRLDGSRFSTYTHERKRTGRNSSNKYATRMPLFA